jgi:hypothetical protein
VCVCISIFSRALFRDVENLQRPRDLLRKFPIDHVVARHA